MGWLIVMDCVISWANEWENYFNDFGEGVRISRDWATTHCLAFYGWPQNCHGAGGCVTQPLPTYYNACLMRPKVYWKLNLRPSWTQLVLTSFHHILQLGHSFKGYILPPFHLFHFHKHPNSDHFYYYTGSSHGHLKPGLLQWPLNWSPCSFPPPPVINSQ